MHDIPRSGEIWPTTTRAWLTVFVLLLAYTSSFIDRQILSLLVGPIRQHLDISDTQFSLLHGAAFVLFYTTLGLAAGRIADHGNRRNLIILGIVTWSAMTMGCGLANSFGMLFAARVGVGAGEACLSPAAYSMLSDSFPQRRLARALSVYSTGIAIGVGLALMLGGSAIEVAVSTDGITLPVLGHLRPWQTAFVIVGVAGLVPAVLMLFLREPVRHEITASQSRQAGRDTTSSASVLAYLRQHRAVYSFLFLGLALWTAVAHAFGAWAPALFMRTFHWSPGEYGLIQGANFLVSGTAGILSGGWFAGWLVTRGFKDALMRAPALGALALIPFGILAPLADNAVLATALFAPLVFFSLFPIGVASAAIQVITPNRFRGQLSALYLFTINLIGLGLGPTLVAVFTDFVFADDLALKYSLSLLSAVAAPLAAVLLWSGLKHYRQKISAE